MNQESGPLSPVHSPPVADANATCDGCGVFGAFAFGDGKLCLNCYTEKGSCCAEFGKDELWRDREQFDGTKRKT